MEMTIAIQKADYNEVAKDRIIHLALTLGFSLEDNGEKRIIRFFGVDKVSKISKLARKINIEKGKQERLEQFA